MGKGNEKKKEKEKGCERDAGFRTERRPAPTKNTSVGVVRTHTTHGSSIFHRT